MSVYVTLPSNASMSQHPRNRGGDYTTELQETLHLDSRWEVGLVEAIFRQDWPNIRAGEEFTILLEAIDDAQAVKTFQAWNRWQDKYSEAFRLNNFEFQIENRAFRYFNIYLHAFSLEEALSLLNATFNSVQLGAELVIVWTSRGNPEVQFRKIEGQELKKNFRFSRDFAVLFRHLKVHIATSIAEYVALTSAYPNLLVPHFWDASDPGENLIDKTFPKGLLKSWPIRRPPQFIESIRSWRAELEEGHYESIDEVVREMNRVMETAFHVDQEDMPLLTLVPMEHSPEKARRIEFNFRPDYSTRFYAWRLILAPTLARILGLGESSDGRYYIYPGENLDLQSMVHDINVKSWVEPLQCIKFRGKHPVDLAREMAALWIYSDIAYPQITGHNRSPILRVIPLDRSASRGDTVMVHYEKAHYLPIAYHTVSTIHIRVYNSYGLAPIPFISDVIVKLHFRRRRRQLVNYKRLRIEEAEEEEEDVQ